MKTFGEVGEPEAVACGGGVEPVMLAMPLMLPLRLCERVCWRRVRARLLVLLCDGVVVTAMEPLVVATALS